MPELPFTHCVVDSIEEGVAALEMGGGLAHWPVALLPTPLREGDVLAITRESDGGAGECVLRIRVDAAARDEALRRSRAQVAAPPSGDPGGDIVL